MFNNKHNFHFVLTKELKYKIVRLSKKLNLSISKTSIYILEKTLGILKKYNYKMEELDEISKYQSVFWDQDMHIYLEKDFYRKIKHLSDTMFAFSIAIVVRCMFNFYFDNEDKIEEVVNKINKEIEDIEKRIKKYRKRIRNKQLSYRLSHKLTFNNEFSIVGIDFF